MIFLEMINPRWSNPENGGVEDQCVHGEILFQINNTTFANLQDGELSPVTAALYLMRSIEREHTLTDSITSGSKVNIFPHCGFTVWVQDNKLLIMGCDNGVNFEIKHLNGVVVVVDKNGTIKTISESEWKYAVRKFAEQISKFYETESPKEYIEDTTDREGWEMFWKEFHERLSRI